MGFAGWPLLLLMAVSCGARAESVCVIPAGTYVAQFKQSGPEAGCPAVPDQMVAIEADGTIAGAPYATDGGWAHGELDVNSSTCSSRPELLVRRHSDEAVSRGARFERTNTRPPRSDRLDVPRA